MRTKIFLDTEFTGLTQNSTLISVALVSECGISFYAEFTDYNTEQLNAWIESNVINNLFLNNEEKQADKNLTTIKGNSAEIVTKLKLWLTQFNEIQIWADVLAYDWVLFCELFGGALNIPKNIHYIPMEFSTYLQDKNIDIDIKREELLRLNSNEILLKLKKHNALYDATIGILILEAPKKENKHSFHIFSFPFKWKKWDTEWEASLKETFDIKVFNKITTNHWTRVPFKLDSELNYNEYNYFYEYVREVLYDTDSTLKTYRSKNSDKLINEYRYSNDEISQYCIKVNDTEYILDIEKITIKVYRTGTAILSFHLDNNKYNDFQDILKINKFGRKLFLPFFSTENNIDFEEPYNIEVPESISLGKYGSDHTYKPVFTEDFKTKITDSKIKHGPFVIPAFIEGLFPTNFMFYHEQFATDENHQKDKTKYSIYIRPILNENMFVTSWYGNTAKASEITKKQKQSEEDWYKFIFVDTSLMQQDKDVLKETIKKQTYSRWTNYNTYYGVSRYSFVTITNDYASLDIFIINHMKTMYFKMVELCLLQRATVLSFSDEVVHVSNLIDKTNHHSEKKTNITNRIESLYKHYILFVNKIYFREITSQEQGIEIYDLIQNTMRIPRDVKDLDNELDELNRFASIQADKQESIALKRQAIQTENMTSEAHKLTQLATWFLAPTLIAGIFGMNMLEKVSFPSSFEDFNNQIDTSFLFSLLAIILLTGITIKLLNKYFLKRNKNE